MRRYAYRKWVVLLALMCQVLSATLVHLPSAEASTPAEQAAAAPCADHGHMDSSGDAAANGAHGQHSAPDHVCKVGHCKCPCAHASVMAIDSVASSPPTPHLPITLVYVSSPVPERSTPFFRPPI